MCLAVSGSCCTGEGAAVEGYGTLASLPAQLAFTRKVGGRGECCSPGPHLTWSQHLGQGRHLDLHSALLVCMHAMTYPEDPGEEFPSETCLRALTCGLNQGVTQGENVDVDDVGACPLQARAGLQGLLCQLFSPTPPFTRWPGDISGCDAFLHKNQAQQRQAVRL